VAATGSREAGMNGVSIGRFLAQSDAVLVPEVVRSGHSSFAVTGCGEEVCPIAAWIANPVKILQLAVSGGAAG
jgi:hypothetical protein